MPGPIGPTELAIILVIILILFGGSKLPELARSLGKAKREFQAGMKEGGEATPKTLEIARNMGIPVEGKSEQELLKEIETRTKGPVPGR